MAKCLATPDVATIYYCNNVGYITEAISQRKDYEDTRSYIQKNCIPSKIRPVFEDLLNEMIPLLKTNVAYIKKKS